MHPQLCLLQEIITMCDYIIQCCVATAQPLWILHRTSNQIPGRLWCIVMQVENGVYLNASSGFTITVSVRIFCVECMVLRGRGHSACSTVFHRSSRHHRSPRHFSLACVKASRHGVHVSKSFFRQNRLVWVVFVPSDLPLWILRKGGNVGKWTCGPYRLSRHPRFILYWRKPCSIDLKVISVNEGQL